MKQGQELVAKVGFTMRKTGSRGRAMSVKTGDKFWITTSTINNDVCAKIDRVGKGFISQGYLLTIDQINELFEVVKV